MHNYMPFNKRGIGCIQYCQLWLENNKFSKCILVSWHKCTLSSFYWKVWDSLSCDPRRVSNLKPNSVVMTFTTVTVPLLKKKKIDSQNEDE